MMQIIELKNYYKYHMIKMYNFEYL